MKIVNDLALNRDGEVTPGTFSMAKVSDGYAYGIVVDLGQGEIGYVILEGTRAGEFEEPEHGKGLILKSNKVCLKLSSESRHWSYGTIPSTRLPIALYQGRTYLVIGSEQKKETIDLETGLLVPGVPRNAYFVTHWGIYLDDNPDKAPLIEHPVHV